MPSTTHRPLAKALASVLGVLALAACSSSEAPAAEDTSPISIITDNTAWKDGIQKTGDAIKKQTGRGFDVLSIPNDANFAQVRDQSLSGKPADIVKTSVGLQLKQLAATGNLTDLTPVWDQAVKDGNLDDGLRPYFSVDGKVYAVPYSISYTAVYYSKAAFAKAGISAPPKSLAELEDAAAKLKAAGSTPIFNSASEWQSIYPPSLLAGSIDPSFYQGLTENTAKWSDPAGREVFQTWQKWLKNGWMSKYDDTGKDIANQLKSGAVGMYLIGTWTTGTFATAGLKPVSDYGIFPFPQKTPGTQSMFIEATALSVPTKAPHHDAAVKQIAAWLSPEAQTVWANYLNDNPMNPKVTVDNPAVNGLATQVKGGNTKVLVRIYEALPPAMVQELVSAWSNFALHPDQLDQTLETSDSTAAKGWDTWKQQNQ